MLMTDDGSIPFHEFQREAMNLIEPHKAPKFVLEPLRSIRPILTQTSLIKGLLQSTGLAVLFGAPGTCKSFVAISAGLHVAAGRDWAGRKVRQTGVVYVAAEGGAGFRKRVYAAVREFDIPLDSPFCLMTVAPNLGAAQGDTTVLVREIREQAAFLGFKPGLIILDTLARTIVGADESSSRDMGVFIDNADTISRELKACVLAVHHTGKAADKGMRGSSALHGAADTEWEIVISDEGKSIKLAKQKDGEDGFSFEFSTRTVEVGIDEDGEPVTTLVAEISGEWKHPNVSGTRGPKKLTGQRAEFIKAAALAIDEMGEKLPISEHLPRGNKGVKRHILARYAEQLGFLGEMAPKTRKSTLDRHIRTLAGDGLLGQWGEWIWLA